MTNFLKQWRVRRSQPSRFTKFVSRNAVALTQTWHFVLAGFLSVSVGLVFLLPQLLSTLGVFTLPLTLVVALFAAGQFFIAVGLRRATSWSRRAAIASNILLTAVSSFLAFQIAHWILLFTLIGDAFYAAFGGFAILVAGLAWWVFSERLLKRIHGDSSEAQVTPDNNLSLRFVNALKRIGQLIAAVGLVIWAVQFNPFAIVFMAVSALFFPNPLAIGFVVIAALSILIMRALLSESMSRYVKANQAEGEKLAGWIFVAPSLLGFMAFLAGPLLYSLVMSFFDWNISSQMKFVGFDNYFNTLGLQVVSNGASFSDGYLQIGDIFGLAIGASDPLFWKAMSNICIFLITAVPLAVIPALILATLIELRLPGSKLFRAIFFIPSVAGVIGVTLIWKQMLNSSVGFFNYAIQEIFLFLNFLLPGDPLPTRVEIGWLSTEQWALAAVVVVFAWSQFGFNTVLFIAGLQSISKELYEAAELDGANAFQRFRNVTLPALRPTTFFVTATTIILALQLFDVVFALNQPNVVGFPNNATLTPVVYLYQLGFQQGNFGRASAVAWILFAVIFVFTIIQFNRQKKEAETN
jgi:ABC-type sugar transport system permease subunit